MTKSRHSSNEKNTLFIDDAETRVSACNKEVYRKFVDPIEPSNAHPFGRE